MNDRERRKFIIRFIIFACVIVTLVFVLIWHHEDNNYTDATNYYTTEANRNVRSIKHYTNSYVIRNFDKTEPNIDSAESSSARRIYQAINLAYGHCQTQSRFNANQNHIKQLLGNNLSNYVLHNVKPTTSGNYSGVQSPSQKIYSTRVGYGKFDTVSKSFPINVVICYKTPKYTKGLTGHKSYVHYSAYQLNYRPKNSYATQFSVQHYDNGANDWNRIFK